MLNNLFSQLTKNPDNIVRLAQLSTFLLQIVKSYCLENNIEFSQQNMSYELYKSAKQHYLQKNNLLINYSGNFPDNIGVKNSEVVNRSNVEIIIEERKKHPTARIAAINLANGDHPLGACLNGKPGSQEEYYGYNSSLLFDILDVLQQNNHTKLADTFIKTFYRHVVDANGNFILPSTVKVNQWVEDFTNLKTASETHKEYNLFENISVYHENVIFFSGKNPGNRNYQIPETIDASKAIVLADVISVAAINLAWWRIFSPSSKLLNDAEAFTEATTAKLANVCQQIQDKKVAIFVGGALGSGAFKNNPYEIAKIFYDQLQKIAAKIIFAILITNPNDPNQQAGLNAYTLEAKRRKWGHPEEMSQSVKISINGGDIFNPAFNFPANTDLTKIKPKTAYIIGVNPRLNPSSLSNSVFGRIANKDENFAKQLTQLNPTAYAQEYRQGTNPVPGVKLGFRDAIILPQTECIPAADLLMGICSRNVTQKGHFASLFSATSAACHNPELAAQNLQNAYLNAFKLADEQNVTHLTTTLVGAGEHGISPEISLNAILEAMKKFVAERDKNSEFFINIMPFNEISAELIGSYAEQIEKIQNSVINCNLTT